MKKPFVLLAFGMAWAFSATCALAQEAPFGDDFSSYEKGKCWTDGATFGEWTVIWSGYGCVSVVSNENAAWLNETPQEAKGRSHSALTIGPPFSGSYTYEVTIETVQQLSKHPKRWEVGWILWNYTDPNTFYAIVLKPKGWELDKEYTTSSGGQSTCFLAADSRPQFPIGSPYQVRISNNVDGAGNNTITVSVDGIFLVAYTDSGACGVPAYTSGNLGLYTEAASANFTDVSVTTP